jgi:hypothetical protein
MPTSPAAIVGKLAHLKGQANEEHAIRSLLSRRQLWPAWLLSARRASREEDAKGWDMVVMTEDVGTVGLQVKSSPGEARRFRKRHPHIPVVIVGRHARESQTFLAILDALKEVRERWRGGV